MIMKRRIVYKCAMYFLLSLMLVSCKDRDEDPVPPVVNNPVPPVEDSDAGIFKLLDTSTGSELQVGKNNCIYLYVGDTIKVLFEYKSEYKDFNFTFESEQLNKVGDDLFVVPSNLASAEAHSTVIITVGEPGKPVVISASCTTVKDNVEYKLSAKRDFRVFAYGIPESILVNYYLNVSPELLQFVTPAITCPNENGSSSTSYVLKDEDWEKTEKEHYVVYKNEENKYKYVNVSKGETPEEGWTMIEEFDYWAPYLYGFDRDYTAKNTILTATVSYQQNNNVDISQDSYEFYHKLNWNSKQSGIHMDIDLTDHTVKKEKVQEYIDKLANTHDVVKLSIDRTGRIEEIYK